MARITANMTINLHPLEKDVERIDEALHTMASLKGYKAVKSTFIREELVLPMAEIYECALNNRIPIKDIPTLKDYVNYFKRKINAGE